MRDPQKECLFDLEQEIGRCDPGENSKNESEHGEQDLCDFLRTNGG